MPSCTIRVVVDCEVEPEPLGEASSEWPFSVRVVRTCRTTKGTGRIEPLECICPLPVPGPSDFKNYLKSAGRTIKGRQKNNRRLMKCLIRWTIPNHRGETLTVEIEEPSRYQRRMDFLEGHYKRSLDGSEETAAPKVPEAYQTNSAKFWGLDFYVDSAVMIPRPASEAVVKETVTELRRIGGSHTLLDLGTGSGCLLVATLREVGSGTGVGVELYDNALAVARKNVDSLLPAEDGFSVNLQKGDFFKM